MLFKIKINVMLDIPKKGFFSAYKNIIKADSFGEKNNAIFIINYARKKYCNVLMSQKIFHRMIQGSRMSERLT